MINWPVIDVLPHELKWYEVKDLKKIRVSVQNFAQLQISDTLSVTSTKQVN